MVTCLSPYGGTYAYSTGALRQPKTIINIEPIASAENIPRQVFSPIELMIEFLIPGAIPNDKWTTVKKRSPQMSKVMMI